MEDISRAEDYISVMSKPVNWEKTIAFFVNNKISSSLIV